MREAVHPKGSSAQPVEVYNQGIQLMHAKKFAEAQVKFQQALSENPNFAGGRQPAPNIVAKKRADQEDVGSDYLFAKRE